MVDLILVQSLLYFIGTCISCPKYFVIVISALVHRSTCFNYVSSIGILWMLGRIFECISLNLFSMLDMELFGEKLFGIYLG